MISLDKRHELPNAQILHSYHVRHRIWLRISTWNECRSKVNVHAGWTAGLWCYSRASKCHIMFRLPDWQTDVVVHREWHNRRLLTVGGRDFLISIDLIAKSTITRQVNKFNLPSVDIHMVLYRKPNIHRYLTCNASNLSKKKIILLMLTLKPPNDLYFLKFFK